MPRLPPALLTATAVALLASPMALSHPDGLFQGVGTLEYHGLCTLLPDEEPAIVTVERTPAGWVGTITLPRNFCWLLLTAHPLTASTSLVFFLEGDWSTGFHGEGPPNPGYVSWLDIGPYGDGRDIEVGGWLWYGKAVEFFLDGHVTDVHLA